jgi:hypothetical protein
MVTKKKEMKEILLNRKLINTPETLARKYISGLCKETRISAMGIGQYCRPRRRDPRSDLPDIKSKSDRCASLIDVSSIKD